MTTFVTRDPKTGMRRGPLRWPDGCPPPPFGCRRCGIDPAAHGIRRRRRAHGVGVSYHPWERPTRAQMLARMLARRSARFAARAAAAAETRRLAQGYAWTARTTQATRPERCEEMTYNSIGSETACTWEDPDHDGLCEDGTGFTWLGVRNEERGQ